MPELDFVIYAQCSDIEYCWFEVKSRSSDQIRHVTYTNFRGEDKWSCDCPAGKHGKQCKHIIESKPKRCVWMEFINGGKIVDDKCPRCGKKVVYRKWGV